MNSLRQRFIGLLIALVTSASVTVLAQESITFLDPNLEVAVRTALAKPSDPLTATALEDLKSLSAVGLNISNLSGLEWATNLASLSLSLNSISDLTPLAGMNNLIQLSVDGNLISDLLPLAALSRLTSLNAGGNLISDFSPLTTLTNLTSLWLYGNFPRSVSALTNLSGLTTLSIYNCRLADITPLAGLNNLNYLELRGNPLTNAGMVLAGLTNVTTLFLGGAGISDVSFIHQLQRLTFLDLANNRIGDLAPLTTLPDLRGLDLAYNSLTNIAQLGDFTNLTSLYLSGNAISNLNVLQDLHQLTSLSLSSTGIKNLSFLIGQTNVSELCLGRNPNANFEVLTEFTNLTSLWLEGNSLSNVSFVQGLNRLKALGLRRNHLGDLSDLGALTNLVAVCADYNRLTNITPLTNLPGLMSVQLVGNPLQLEAGSATSEIQSLQLRGVDVTYLPTNQPASIFVSTNWILAANSTSSRDFSVVDDFTPGDHLLVAASSANNELLPDLRVTVDGASGFRTLSVTPASNHVGTAMINLTVTDSAGSVTEAGILVTVQYPTNVAILDPHLEELLREVLFKPTGEFSSVDLLTLSELYVGDSAITTFSGLEWAINLTSLQMVGAAITNWDALQNLTQLRSLGLYDMPLIDLSPLAGLTNLNSLFLAGDSLINLAAVENLTQLTNLVLANLRLADISPLAVLTNLVYLDLSQNRLTDVSPLTNLLNLSIVDLRVNLLAADANVDLDQLQAQGVEVAYFPQNQPPAASVATNWLIAANATSSLSFFVSDDVTPDDQLHVTAISSNPSLIDSANIFIGGTNNSRMLTVTPTVGQTGTVSITVTITDDTGLYSDVNVLVMVVIPQTVIIADVNLEAALRLALGKPAGELYDVDLLSLTEIYVDDPNIGSISGLEWAANLATLQLNATAITNLDGLQNLSHLTSLSLASSRLTDVSSLAALTNLQFLDLAQNRLTDVSPLTNLVNLYAVDLRLNLLETVTNSILQYLENQNIYVSYQPQREPPLLVMPAAWQVAANTTSSLHFSAWNDGPVDERLAIALVSSTGSLVPNTNLFVNRGLDGLAHDWILTAMPPTNYTGTSSITLIASNEVGMSATATVELAIAMPLPLDSQVLEDPNLTWLTGGAAPWFGQTSISYAGGSAAQSGSIWDNEESWLEAIIPGPGILRFVWKVSSESPYDWLEFYVNNQLQDHRISGEVDWESVEVIVPRGLQTVSWRYIKDQDWALGLDAAWVDQLSFVPSSWLELVGISPNGQCQLLLHPPLGKQYTLEVSTNLADWLPLTVAVATNTPIPFLDATADASARFYRLKE